MMGSIRQDDRVSEVERDPKKVLAEALLDLLLLDSNGHTSLDPA